MTQNQPQSQSLQSNWQLFKTYYKLMMYSGDCDPAYPALNYLSDRLEINPNQRYWLSFLYASSYSAPSSYYIFNEFPDPENINLTRFENWWNQNKNKLDFQSDRKKFQNFKGKQSFMTCISSYLNLTNYDPKSTYKQFLSIPDLSQRYIEVYNFSRQIATFGRFTLFNYTESLNEITNLSLQPSTLKLQDAESSRNGLCFACNLEDQITKRHEAPTNPIDFSTLQSNLEKLKIDLQQELPEINVNYWNLETILCSFKKLFYGTRYFGYYIDRQQEELQTIQSKVTEGIEWSILWDFRKEFFDHSLLGELNNWSGIRKPLITNFQKTHSLFPPNQNPYEPSNQYKRKYKFKTLGEIYT